MHRYTEEHNLANKILLVVDGAPGHPPTMPDWCHNIQVVFLPPNTTPLLQPCCQGITATFKAYYTRHTLRQLSDALHVHGIDVRRYWKRFDMKKALEHIAAAWEEVQPRTMNAAWRKLWPEAVHEFKGCSGPAIPCPKALQKEIADLTNAAGLVEGGSITEEEVSELLQSHSEDLMALSREAQTQQESEELPPELPHMAVKKVQEIMEAGRAFCDKVVQNDVDTERSFKVRQGFHNLVQCYEELLNEKRLRAKQTLFMAQNSR